MGYISAANSVDQYSFKFDQQASSSFLCSSGCNHHHSPVLIAPTNEGMARLSWPRWLGEILRRYNTCERPPISVLTRIDVLRSLWWNSLMCTHTLCDRCGQAKQKTHWDSDPTGQTGPQLWPTNSKWHTANGMVTWSMKSRDLKRSRSWPQYIGAHCLDNSWRYIFVTSEHLIGNSITIWYRALWRHVTLKGQFAIWHFLLVVLLNRTSISNGFRYICIQVFCRTLTYWTKLQEERRDRNWEVRSRSTASCLSVSLSWDRGWSDAQLSSQAENMCPWRHVTSSWRRLHHSDHLGVTDVSTTAPCSVPAESTDRYLINKWR